MVANPYLDVDKEILGEVYTSSEPMDNLIILCDEFGSRFPGTPGDRAAVEYMVEKLRSYGLEAPILRLSRSLAGSGGRPP